MPGHLTFVKREVLYRMLKKGYSRSEIALTLGCHRSTVYREIHRNSGGRGYRFQQAQCMADERRLRCRRKPKMDDPAFEQEVTKNLKRGWSPEQIAGRAAKEFPQEPSRRVSHQTIYTWLATKRPELRTHLRRGRRRRGPETRGRIPNRVDIQGRPKAVAEKSRYGDWEGDTVVSPGRRSGLVTMVERKSQYLRVRKTSCLKSASTIRAACRGLHELPQRFRQTLTLDNGKEFSDHRQLTDRLGIGVYFAKPYASWQRGLNENTNGLLRQFFPKGTDFSQVTHRQVARAQQLLNERPRKSLGYKTPSEVFEKKLVAFRV